MEGPNKTIIIITIIFLFLAIFTLSKTGKLPLTLGTPSSYYNVLSASQEETIFNNQLQKVWYITLDSMPGADRIVGIIKKSDVEAKAGVSPKTDFSIDMQTRAELKSKITDTGEPIYKYVPGESEPYYCFVLPTSCAKNYGTPYCKPHRVSALHCQDEYIKSELIGRAGTIGSEQPQVRTITKFTIVAGGQTGTATLDTYGGKTYAPIIVNGKTYGEISWNGDFVDKIPSSLYSFYTPVNLNNQGWYLVNKEHFQQYSNWLLTSEDRDIRDCLNTYNNANFCAIRANYYYLRATIKENVPNVTAIKKEAPFGKTGIFITQKTDQNYRIPTFKIIATVDWVGIERKCAIPSIISLTEQKRSESGTPGQVSAIIKNTAKNSGSLSARLECPAGTFDVLTPTQDVSFSGDEQKTINFYFDADTTKDVTKYCDLIVSNKCYENYKEIKKSVLLHGSPGIGCDAGTISCREASGDDIKDVAKCRADGTGWSLITKCNYGCEYGASGAVCSEIPKCNNCFEWARTKMSKNQYCIPQTIIKKVWYNPTTWMLPSITQNDVCPYYLGGVGLIVLLGILLIVRIVQVNKK